MNLQSRRRRTQQDSMDRRVDRAEALVCMVELFAGRQVLEAAPVAPGLLSKNLKRARRGAAGGLSGMTTEHLRSLLDSEEDCDKFWFPCQAFAQARVLDALRTAFLISGGIRGIIVGDLVGGWCPELSLNRLGQLSRSPQGTSAQCQGCESIAHMLQVNTEQDHFFARQCTALEFSIWSLACPCFEVFREWREVTGCRSSDNSSGLVPRASGKMKKASSTTSLKGKAENKGMR